MDFLRKWFAPVDTQAANAARRWVVLDTETTGIDPERDSLLAIGAVAVLDGEISTADSFEVVLRHTGTTDTSNIALHGLGREALQAGVPGDAALRDFRAWVDAAPCVAFHSDFDRRVLGRAAGLCGVPAVSGPWLDLAPLAAVLRPDVPRKGTGALDDWLTAYGIDCVGRHNAASDALAAAELLLRLRGPAAAQGAIGFAALVALGRHRRWLATQR